MATTFARVCCSYKKHVAILDDSSQWKQRKVFYPVNNPYRRQT